MRILRQFLFILLITIPTLLSAQAPIANFFTLQTGACDTPFVAYIMDISFGSPTSWKWYFPGGTPDTSTIADPPPIIYKTFGCHTIKLVVRNHYGSDSLTDSNYICVDSPSHVTFNGPAILCQGSKAILTAYGGLQYYWSTGVTTQSINIQPQVTTTYSISVTSGSCLKDTDFTVHVDTMPSFKGDTSICQGNNTILYAYPDDSLYAYLWSTGSTADSITVNGNTAGLYSYYFVVSKGVCAKDTIHVTVNVNDCTGIESYTDPSNEIKVYPNPNNGIFNLEIRNYELGINTTVEIYNILGKKVDSQFLIPNSQFLINLSSQPNGVYLYRVITQTGALEGEGKVVIQK